MRIHKAIILIKEIEIRAILEHFFSMHKNVVVCLRKNATENFSAAQFFINPQALKINSFSGGN
jgi:hypothetical protein